MNLHSMHEDPNHELGHNMFNEYQHEQQESMHVLSPDLEVLSGIQEMFDGVFVPQIQGEFKMQPLPEVEAMIDDIDLGNILPSQPAPAPPQQPKGVAGIVSELPAQPQPTPAQQPDDHERLNAMIEQQRLDNDRDFSVEEMKNLDAWFEQCENSEHPQERPRQRRRLQPPAEPSQPQPAVAAPEPQPPPEPPPPPEDDIDDDYMMQLAMENMPQPPPPEDDIDDNYMMQMMDDLMDKGDEKIRLRAAAAVEPRYVLESWRGVLRSWRDVLRSWRVMNLGGDGGTDVNRANMLAWAIKK